MDYKEAVKLLEEGKGRLARDYFKENNYLLEYGYTFLLENEVNTAFDILSRLTSTRAEWATILITYLKGEAKNYPSFFQIRCFLEIDISLLFTYKQYDMINKIINYSDSLQNINQETYKFIARVMLKHNQLQVAKIFLDKSLDDYYKDAELHYLYAEFYIEHNDEINTLKAVNTCLSLNKTYYPALKTLKELTQS